MKTIIDAVNYFKGEYTYDSNFIYFDENGFFGACKDYSVDENNYYICSREEFNQCVKEMTEMNCKSQSVFTKEMQDAGTAPLVGMKLNIEFLSGASYNKSTLTYLGDNVGCFKCKDGKEYTFAMNSINFRAIDNRTDKEKAIDEIMTDEFIDNGLRARDLIEAAYDKWVGE